MILMFVLFGFNLLLCSLIAFCTFGLCKKLDKRINDVEKQKKDGGVL